MNIITKKRIEIGLFVGNLIAFILANFLFMRVFHWIAAIIMVIPLLVTVIFNLRYEYVEWEKKAPSAVPLVVFACIWITSIFICHITLLPDLIIVIFAITMDIAGILTIIDLILFLIRYNIAHNMQRREMQLTPKQHLYNSSIPVIWFVFLIIMWLGTVNITDRIATVTSTKNYEKEIEGYDYFPSSIPEDAKNIEFYNEPGVWLARGRKYIRFQTSKEYLEEYESIYGEDVRELNSLAIWPKETKNGIIYNYISNDYFFKDNCDIYIEEDNFWVMGYAINRESNEIFIFYDGWD